jgi:protein-export membrane protein SecD
VLHFERWKIIAICASIALAALLCIPNILSKPQQELLAGFGLRPMTLGLDLQGGSNVLLEVDRKDLAEQVKQQVSGDIRAALREARIAYSGIQRTPEGVSVKISKPEDMEKAKTQLQALLQPQQGGILSATAQVNLFALAALPDGYALNISEPGMEARIAKAIQQSLRIIENRVNALGTTEPVIQQQGVDRIAVQLPGVQDPDKVKDVIGTTAKLTFQLLCEDQPGGQTQNPPPDCRAYPLKENVDRAIKAKREKGDDAPLTEQEITALPQMWVQISSRATVDGADLTDAQPSFDQNNRPVVSFRFNQKGALRFGKLTAENVNKPFAIILDDVVQSYPVINEPILGGSGQISGSFTVEETSNLAIVLRSGALPAKLTIVEERTVGPSLGADSVRAGFVACAIGLVGVMAFMFLPYGFFGLVANLALLANLLLLIATMSFFGFTLTLPGIAGILLTLGMAVDSNVLIYERIREEWRNGRTALSAIETGFKSALGTVLDANITTLIAAVVLFGVGSGPVRGFAVTLAIGIFTTMFTAFTVSRMLVALWVKRVRPKEINL